jgi:hypothetical protein
MSETALRRTDRLAQTLLLFWTGGGLCFGALAPILFKLIPQRDLAGQVAGAMVARLDTLAWIAFGAATVLVYGLRWVNEVDESLPVTPTKLWVFTAMVALILCLISSGLITPRLAELRAQMGAPIESFAPTHALRSIYDHNHKISSIVFFVRLALALALALAIDLLPRQKRVAA